MVTRLAMVTVIVMTTAACEPMLGITDLTADELSPDARDAASPIANRDGAGPAEPLPIDTDPEDAGHDAAFAPKDAGTDAPPIDYCAELAACCPTLSVPARQSCEDGANSKVATTCKSVWSGLPQCQG